MHTSFDESEHSPAWSKKKRLLAARVEADLHCHVTTPLSAHASRRSFVAHLCNDCRRIVVVSSLNNVALQVLRRADGRLLLTWDSPHAMRSEEYVGKGGKVVLVATGRRVGSCPLRVVLFVSFITHK